MGRVGLISGLAIAALAVGGCGTALPGGDSGPSGTVAATTTAPRGGGPQSVDPPGGGSEALPASPVFPLTVRRTGGIAGFDDTVVLQADGHLRVDTTSVKGRRCTLTKPQQRQMVAALGTLRLGVTPGSDDGSSSADGTGTTDGSTGSGPVSGGDGTDPGESDLSAISVVDVRGRLVDLSGSSLAGVLSMVSSLVSDVTLSQPSATACTTPTVTQAPTASPSAG